MVSLVYSSHVLPVESWRKSQDYMWSLTASTLKPYPKGMVYPRWFIQWYPRWLPLGRVCSSEFSPGVDVPLLPRVPFTAPDEPL